MSSDPPPPTDLDDEITNACQRIYSFPPHEWQSSVIRSLVTAHRQKKKTNKLLVRPTGGGKSLVYQVSALLMKGVTIFISPLLALASDQTEKLRKRTSNIHSIASLHLDGMKASSIKSIADSISDLRDMTTGECTGGSVILFVSPQFLIGTRGKLILDALLNEQTSPLHMVVMDEIHIASQFGNTFRSEFRLLKSKFYSKLPTCSTINLFMTGTCTQTILNDVQKLFGLKIPDIDWPTHEQMQHRSVSISLKFTPLLLNHVKSNIATILRSGNRTSPKKVIIYSNMRRKIQDFAKKIGGFLNVEDRFYTVDYITIHGELSHQEKAAYLKRFMAEGEQAHGDIRILLATSGVANAGIDSREIHTAIRIEFPPSILDICQEKGRVGRIMNASPAFYSYDIVFDTDSFIALLKRTLNPSESMNDAYRKKMLKDHIDVAKLFCRTDGCFNETFEHVLANPFVTNIETDENYSNRCNICPGCSGHLKAMYNEVNISGAKDLLFTAFTRNVDYNIKDLTSFFASDENVDRMLFKRRRNKDNVPKREIKLFIFQLIAWEILVPELKQDTNDIIFKASVTTDSPAMYIFHVDDYWKHIPST